MFKTTVFQSQILFLDHASLPWTQVLASIKTFYGNVLVAENWSNATQDEHEVFQPSKDFQRPALFLQPVAGLHWWFHGWFYKDLKVHTSVCVWPDLALSRCSELCGISQYWLAPRAWSPGFRILLFLLYYKLLSVKLYILPLRRGHLT